MNMKYRLTSSFAGIEHQPEVRNFLLFGNLRGGGDQVGSGFRILRQLADIADVFFRYHQDVGGRLR